MAAAPAAALFALSVAGLAHADQNGPAVSTQRAAVDDAAAVSRLCRLIVADVVRLPKGASVEDLEASIVYTLSQARAERRIIGPALICAAGNAGDAPSLRQAFANVQQSYGGPGTASLAQAGFGNGGNAGSFFSAPAIAIGGGTSNYTPVN